MLESLFNKVAGQAFSCEYCEFFKNAYFEEHQRANSCFCLCEEEVKTYLESLYRKFVINAIDKDANNYGLICINRQSCSANNYDLICITCNYALIAFWLKLLEYSVIIIPKLIQK